MDLLFLDFETYYDKEYSLTKMPPPCYILDPKFEVICCAVKKNDEPSYVVDGPDFGAFIATLNPDNICTVTYNALFDNAILAWQYGFVPAFMLDSMNMARSMYGHEIIRFSLAKVAEHMGVGTKGTEINQVIGMNRLAIKAAGLWPSFLRYANNDNELSAGIFFKLIKRFPNCERRIMDMVIRAAVCPKFIVDTKMLTDHLVDLKQQKLTLMQDAGVLPREDALGFPIDYGTDEGVAFAAMAKSKLMSSAKFVALLERQGVIVETKPSPTNPDKELPALSKGDSFMARLLDHENQTVAALAAARLGHKSTLEETRSKMFLAIGELPWHYRDGNPATPRIVPHGGGTLPIPLVYGAAHTHRFGGGWKMNPQNMPTSRGSKGRSKLRRSLLAPPGHSVVVCDLGQIEARLVAWLCGAKKLLKEFEEKLDPYNKLGSSIFGYPVDRKKPEFEVQGFIGKTGILGLGYGCGPDKFYTMVLTMARAQGIFDKVSKIFDERLAKKSVYTYRGDYPEVKDGWEQLDRILGLSWMGLNGPVSWGGPDHNVVEIAEGSVHLPNEMYLNYGLPHTDPLSSEKFYRFGAETHKIYGAKFLENIDQALARIVVMNAALRIEDHGRCKYPAYRGAFRFVLQAHDELVYIIPNEILDDAKVLIHSEMIRRPSWGKTLPLVADISHAASYGEAK